MENLTELWKIGKEVVIAIYNVSHNNGKDDFKFIILNPDGTLCGYFSYYCCGDLDEYYIELEPEDLINDIETTKAKYQKRIDDEEAEFIARTKEKQRLEAEEKEKNELIIYNKLKLKFETLDK